MVNNCLLLIDIQNDYFPKGKMELTGMNDAAANAQLLLKVFRKAKLPIVHIQHFSTRPGSTFFLPKTTGVEIHKRVTPSPGEVIVKKSFPNSFRATELLNVLDKAKTNTLTICGAMSHMCIDATTRAAFDHEFRCIVAEDGCATRDLQFQDKKINARHVHASFMAALSAPYADVLTTEQVIGKMVDADAQNI